MLKLKNLFKKKSPSPAPKCSPSVENALEGSSTSSGAETTTLEIAFQKKLTMDGQEKTNGGENYEIEGVFGTGAQGQVDISGESSLEEEEEEPQEAFAEQAELRNYKLIEKIGEGAFSKVYRGVCDCTRADRDSVSSRYNQVAIKVIIKKNLPHSKCDGEKTSKATTREQVLKEITIHKMVSSGKNIVTFIDFQESDSYFYIVQELLAGGEIFGEIVKYTYFSEDLSRHVIKQLAQAVKHMHQLGVVHRDIKPENLLFEPIDFTPNPNPKLRKSDDPSTKVDEGIFTPGIGGGGIGTIKLADFGLSKQIYQTNTKTPCGTVGYTAPEVVKDERYSMQVDMWGVGCVLYTVLCGFPPFFDEKIDILTEKIARGEYTFLRPWWDEISDGAKYCVSKLLEVDPERRYTVEQLLDDPWLNSYDCVESSAAENISRSNRRHSHKHERNIYMKNAALLYSPAAVAMRDAFDISNAVQRIEDDRRTTPGPKSNLLGSLAEDAEVEFEHSEPFNLKLDSSSIIKRRRNNV